jgi:hypothetical protein
MGSAGGIQVKRIIGFLAGSKVYQKAQEDLLVQSHYQKVREDFIQKLGAITPRKLSGKLSDML